MCKTAGACVYSGVMPIQSEGARAPSDFSLPDNFFLILLKFLLIFPWFLYCYYASSIIIRAYNDSNIFVFLMCNNKSVSISPPVFPNMVSVYQIYARRALCCVCSGGTSSSHVELAMFYEW